MIGIAVKWNAILLHLTMPLTAEDRVWIHNLRAVPVIQPIQNLEYEGLPFPI